MKKAIFAIAAATTIAAGTMSAPTTAGAGCYGCGVGAGVLGGVVAGTIIGGAIANSQPHYYAPEPGAVAYQYGAPPPVACPGGYWSRRPVAFDAYGNPVGWSRPRFVCP
jgi:hypothetical protein